MPLGAKRPPFDGLADGGEGSLAHDLFVVKQLEHFVQMTGIDRLGNPGQPPGLSTTAILLERPSNEARDQGSDLNQHRGRCNAVGRLPAAAATPGTATADRQLQVALMLDGIHFERQDTR